MKEQDTIQNTRILDGKKVATEIKNEISESVKAMVAAGHRPPHLAVILLGKDGASHTYVGGKEKACREVGFTSSVINLDSSISEEALLDKIQSINNNPDIDGLIVQLPLPDHIRSEKITEAINPNKDVDGFTAANFGKINRKNSGFLPATPQGVMELLKRYKIQTKGKHAVVVGRSHIVGSPMSILLARPGDATVTLCHRFTKNLKEFTSRADILVVAVGIPGFIKKDMVKEGAVIVDVGTTRVDDPNHPRGFVLKGDVAFDEVATKASYISPVPGGVGPMTIASLLMNTLKAAKLQH